MRESVSEPVRAVTFRAAPDGYGFRSVFTAAGFGRFMNRLDGNRDRRASRRRSVFHFSGG